MTQEPDRYNLLTETMFVKRIHILTMVLLLAASVPSAAAKPREVSTRLTAEEFDALIATLSRKNDADAARAIAATTLTERPRQSAVERWAGEMPGRRASAALHAVTDEAWFLKPPKADTPADPEPDARTQSAIMGRAAEYVKNTVHKLPNFSAVRGVSGFELATEEYLANDQFNAHFLNNKSTSGPKPRREDLGAIGSMPAAHLYLDEVWEDTVTYRDGHEVVDTSAPSPTPGQLGAHRLSSVGEFGPVLSVVMSDASHGKIAWGRWERDAAGVLAVFR